MNLKILSIRLFVILSIYGCGSSKKDVSLRPSLSDTETATYKQTEKRVDLRPEYMVYHLNDSISEVHFQLNSQDLLYTRREGDDLTANCLFNYELTIGYNSKAIADSGTVKVIDVKNSNTEKYLTGTFQIRIKSGDIDFMKVTALDMNRNLTNVTVIKINKSNNLNRQSFLVTHNQNSVPLFNNLLKTGETVNIVHNSGNQKRFFVKCYFSEFPLSPPPFSTVDSQTFNYSPDSVFTISVAANEPALFTPFRKGIYHIQTDSSQKEGYTLLVFSTTFPKVKTSEELLAPIRFISSKEEYDEMEMNANTKAAVEQFWMNRTSNREKARVLIRKYYNRVEKANNYFTSYTEGWKTDRGMIYLIYGNPTNITKGEFHESWVYLEENTLNSIAFNFIKVENPFTDNDYVVERSSNYRQSWYGAVDVWRVGRAYYLDE